MSKVTKNQFDNILAFVAIMGHSKYVLELSPDYIIDKYERYIGDPKLVTDSVDSLSGLHPVLREEIIEQYYRIWGGDIESSIIRSDKIRMAIEDYTPDKPMSEKTAKEMALMLELYIKHKKDVAE
jgi:hypothetical protein